MSKPPETWTQDGPLGRELWRVEFHGFEVDFFVTDGSDLTVTGTVSGDVNGPGRLRAFARALDRAADALEAAAEPEGDGAACVVCGCEVRTPAGYLQCECPAPAASRVDPDLLQAMKAAGPKGRG